MAAALVGALVVAGSDSPEPASPGPVTPTPVDDALSADAPAPAPLPVDASTTAVAREAQAGAVELEPTEPVHWTAERMRATAQSHLRLEGRQRELVLRPFGAWLGGKDRELAAQLLGQELSEAWFAELLAVEAPWNADLAALGQLHADDLDRALRDTWDGGHYHVETPGPEGTLRHPEVGESRIAFPERAYYYRLPSDRFPHLEEQRRQRKDLVHGRSAAVRGRLAELVEASR